MPEVRNAINKVLADGRYLKLDCSNGPLTATLQCQNIEPTTDATYSLGSTSKRFYDIWLSYDNNSRIYFGKSTAYIKPRVFLGLGIIEVVADFFTIGSTSFTNSGVRCNIGSSSSGAFYVQSGSTQKFVVAGSANGGITFRIGTGTFDVQADLPGGAIFQIGSGTNLFRVHYASSTMIIDTFTNDLRIAGYEIILDSSTDVVIGNGVDNKNLKFGAGEDAGIKYDGTDLIIDTDIVGSGSCKINSLEIDNIGAVLPISSADGSAPNNSIYYSTTSSKLVYKDSGGTAHDLY